MREISRFLGVLVLVTGFAAQAAKVESGPTIKVGVALRFAPELNSFAGNLFEGMQMAEEDFNTSKTPFDVELVKFDHKSTHESIERAADQILKAKINYVLGGEMSDDVFTLADKFKGQPILLLSPTASNPLLTAGKPFVFSAGLSDDIVAANYAKFVASLKTVKSVGILHNTSNAYSDFITNAFLDGYEKLKSKSVQIQEFRYASEKPQFESAVEQFKKNNVDTVIAFTLQESLKAFEAAASKGGLKVLYIGSDGWGTNMSIIKALPGIHAIRNTYWNRDGKAQSVSQFRTRFEKKFGHAPNSWCAQGYDTAMALFGALKIAKNSADPIEVAEALHSTSVGNGVTTHTLKFNRKNWLQKPMYLYEIEKDEIKFLKEMN